MTSIKHNWKRFWVPRSGGSIILTTRGYPYDPESEWTLNPDLVPYDKISPLPCLILLGEPGIGKSTALAGHADQMKAQGCHVFTFNLRDYSTDGSEFFRSMDDLLSSPENVETVHLFLDSLDEGRLSISTIASVLSNKFSKIPTQRVLLRIACRTADWPQSLEECLNERWGKENVHAFELAPLLRRDVETAAKDYGLDAEKFLQEIDAREAGPLAIKPITLRFLLEVYTETAALPSSKAEIYRKGVLLMCREISESRFDARFTGDLDPNQRMLIAGRIAMVSVFSNRDSIWTSLESGRERSSDLTIPDLAVGQETDKGITIDISEGKLRETLATALFSSRGPDCLGFAHRTYAEFLAAWYLDKIGLDHSQLLGLICSSSEYEGKIIPQLHETAAWLATLKPELFNFILEKDPKVLLKSDVATAEPSQRENLAVKLLELYDREECTRDWGESIFYAKLKYPGLADLLRKYIHDSTMGWQARYVAIDIAEACGLKNLQNDILNIALDFAQSLTVRENAAQVLAKIADPTTKLSLKPLVLGDHPDDENDQLKASILQALWPDQLSAAELFHCLTSPRRSHHIGAYYMFISYELPPTLRSTDLTTALEWVQSHSFSYDRMGPLIALRDKILVKALENLFEDNVLDLFCRIVLQKTHDHEQLLKHLNDKKNNERLDRLRSDSEKRRAIIETLVMLIDDPEKRMFEVIWNDCVRPIPDDIPWIADKLLASCSFPAQKKWAWLIFNLLNCTNQITDSAIYEAILSAREKNSFLRELTSRFFDPIELDSALAQKLKEHHQKIQRYQRFDDEPPSEQSSAEQQIKSLLDQFEAGDLSAWWKLNRIMTILPDQPGYFGDENMSDLTDLPGWNGTDKNTHERIILAAKDYLNKMRFNPDNIIPESKVFSLPHAAQYRALRLVLKVDAAWVDLSSGEDWKRFAPVIVWYRENPGHGALQARQELLGKAYSMAPDETLSSIEQIIDDYNAHYNSFYELNNLKICLDDRICSLLLKKAGQTRIKDENKFWILHFLAGQGRREAIDCAKTLVPDPLPRCGPAYATTLAAARVVLLNLTNDDWPFLWKLINLNSQLGVELFTSGLLYSDTLPLASLAEDCLSDLYIWLESVYPHADDPPPEGWGHYGPRELRNQVITQLHNRGTWEACGALERLREYFPELSWLRRILIEARINAARKSWAPAEPRELVELVTNADKRLVQTGDDLVKVVIESLRRMESKLQGETPAAKFLWNEIKCEAGKPVVFRPKDEGDFSDWIKNHLDEDIRSRGIIINREVEISRSKGGASGERTDVRVDASVKQSRDKVNYVKISVIIEVKGCWNPALMTDMGNQLANRYLEENQVCKHGIYVVGWFRCDQWDPQDRRKKANPKIETQEQAQTLLDQQAKELFTGGKFIRAVVINTSLR